MTSPRIPRRKPAPDLPPPLERVLRSAAGSVDAVRGETRTVAANVERTVRAAATTMRKTGETLSRDPKRFVEGVVRDATSGFRTVGADVSREAGKVADEVARRVVAVVEPALESALHRLNVPTQKDLRSLVAKVDALSRKLEQLQAKPRRSRSRKTA